MFASGMNKGVVVFLKEEHFVYQLMETGITLNGLFDQVSPLAVPSMKITVSGVPPFILNRLLENRFSAKMSADIEEMDYDSELVTVPAVMP